MPTAFGKAIPTRHDVITYQLTDERYSYAAGVYSLFSTSVAQASIVSIFSNIVVFTAWPSLDEMVDSAHCIAPHYLITSTIFIQRKFPGGRDQGLTTVSRFSSQLCFNHFFAGGLG